MGGTKNGFPGLDHRRCGRGVVRLKNRDFSAGIWKNRFLSIPVGCNSMCGPQ
jgi:hypothetical protein